MIRLPNSFNRKPKASAGLVTVAEFARIRGNTEQRTEFLRTRLQDRIALAFGLRLNDVVLSDKQCGLLN